MQPAELELALAALEELESRDQAIGRQWQMRIERAEYEAALAERRYLEVDPSQRLVASTLERRWNDALLQLEDLKKQAAEFQRQEARVATPEQKAKVLALAKDLPRVWHAPTTQAKDRKRMLRLLIKDITVDKPAPQAAFGSPPLAGRGLDRPHGATPAHHSRPRALSCRTRRQSPKLAHDLLDAEIANQLNQQGHASITGKPYTTSMIQWIRFRYGITPPVLQKARRDDRPTSRRAIRSQRSCGLLLDPERNRAGTQA